jgi:acyl dehydratase
MPGAALSRSREQGAVEMSTRFSADETAGRALYFDDYSVGMEFVTEKRQVHREDIRAFSDLTGDDNPLHTDPVFAESTRFGEVVVHGLLGTSVAVGLIARLGIVTGTVLALLEVNCRFRRPIVATDEVHARVVITKMRGTSKVSEGILWRKVDLINQRGETVQEIDLVSLMKRRAVIASETEVPAAVDVERDALA